MSWMAKGTVVQLLAGALSLEVTWPKHKAEDSPPFHSEVKNEYSYIPFTPPDVFIVCTEQLYLNLYLIMPTYK
jgi:hypothetical protein